MERSLQDHMFHEIESHLISDDKPSIFLEEVSQKAVFSEFPYSMLLRLKTTPQQKEHHPEGSVWNHTLLVVNEAAKRREKSSDARAFMWASLLHDIGKADTTRIRKGKITSYDHDMEGAKQAVEFLSFFSHDEVFINSTAMLVRWHMQILFVVKDLPYADVKSMKKETNVHDIALLGLCDRLGRGGTNVKKEKENIRLFLSKVKRD